MSRSGAVDSDGNSIMAKYFTANKNDLKELKAQLNQNNKEIIKEACKVVIARMTLGKDMSSLFTDVVKNMGQNDLGLKKLIYLFIINNAREKPDDVILVVNSFQRDAQNEDPIIRALAIRTMACICEKIGENIADTIGQALKDTDAYVRKTAAIAVAKLFAYNAELVEDSGFVDDLRGLISDNNAMVVSNAVASLAEMSETSGRDLFQMNTQVLGKLLNAMQQCTEWGVVYIMDAIAKYEPDPTEAQDVVERVSPSLQHSNAAVVLSTVRVIVRYLDRLDNRQLEEKMLLAKLPPPLVSLVMNHRHEIQYVALTNINLIIQKATSLRGPDDDLPLLLSEQVQNFFCRYNDPAYIKLEKLEILVKLATLGNIDKVLTEFKTYCMGVDVEFVRKSVLAIGRCAIKLNAAAERCIVTLMDLIKSAEEGHDAAKYIIQETIVVIRDIFRKYPERFEGIITVLCDQLDTLNEPGAKAAIIWIIGEYSARIDNAPDLLGDFQANFLDEPAQVQLALLTAIVKLFLHRPEESRELVAAVFEQATNQEDNPDVRDRGYMYWRLCFTSVQVAADVVMSPKPVISDGDFNHPLDVLNVLIANLSTLSSVYHKPPEQFIKDGKATVSFRKVVGGQGDSDSDSDSDDEEDAAAEPEQKEEQPEPAAAAAAQPNIMDMFGMGDIAAEQPAQVETKQVAPPRYQENGLVIRTRFEREGGAVFYCWDIENSNQGPLTGLQVQFDKNCVGVQPLAANVPVSIAPGQSGSVRIAVGIKQPPVDKHNGELKVAMRTNFFKMSYFNDAGLVAHPFFEEKAPNSGHIERNVFLDIWGRIAEADEVKTSVDPRGSADEIKTKFESGSFNVLYIALRRVNMDDGTAVDVLYLSTCLKAPRGNIPVLALLTFNGSNCVVSTRSNNKPMAAIGLKGITDILAL